MIAVLVIGVIFLLFKLFGGKSSGTDQDLVKQLIAAKDSVIKAKNENIADRERLIEEKEKGIVALHERDSILNVHYLEGEITYKKLSESIKNIPNRISHLVNNPDSIARAFADF